MARVLSVVIATSNEGKLAELRSLLVDLPIELVSVHDVVGDVSLAEDSDTFEGNAEQKARDACRLTRMLCLADDSGLEVDALGGRPGVRTARFAHNRATDAENNAALLRELEEINEEARGARFRCVLALAGPWNTDVQFAEGRCDGRIARTPRGSGGFGYDPLFVVDECEGRAMAELGEDEKSVVSHRARAVRALRPALIAAVDAQLEQAESILCND